MARRRSNTGIPGLSFSWKRALGVSSAKRRVARYTGIPTTRQGRQAKLGRSIGCLIPTLLVLLVPILLFFWVIA